MVAQMTDEVNLGAQDTFMDLGSGLYHFPVHIFCCQMLFFKRAYGSKSEVNMGYPLHRFRKTSRIGTGP